MLSAGFWLSTSPQLFAMNGKNGSTPRLYSAVFLFVTRRFAVA